MPRPDHDEYLTLRIPRSAVAVTVALAVHVVLMLLVRRIPEPKPPPQRIEMSIAAPSPSPPPPTTAAPQSAQPSAPRLDRPRSTSTPPATRPPPPPPTTPVLPELPPKSPDAPRVAAGERNVAPAPPPEPSWRDRTLAALAATRPASPASLGVLQPSSSSLDRIAAADPRLYDERTERRLMEDHGAFFRRGLEALRGHWHPEDVLRVTERDPQRRCGRENRTTYAVAVLDRQGNVVDVDLKRPSGCPDLDVEALAAFRRVAQFPNPPAGIFVGPEGQPLETARYPVRFIVTFDGGLRLDWWG